MLASIIIRTYNEEKHLPELLGAIKKQNNSLVQHEVIIVDSGSIDKTLEIAEAHGCRITQIARDDFTFGRSLNIGCELANGDYLVFISGHCIPATDDWLTELIKPLYAGITDYNYGRHLGRDTTKFSEYHVFDKYYPSVSKIPQEGFFCNNANAAITKAAWQRFGFNEDLTGLEDMHLAKRLTESGGKVAYIAEAPVYHIHNETWHWVKIRYERESLALQKIMPEVHITAVDAIRYFYRAVILDFNIAIRKRHGLSKIKEIILFRFMQYWGAYCGNHEQRKISKSTKEKYFYPKN